MALSPSPSLTILRYYVISYNVLGPRIAALCVCVCVRLCLPFISFVVLSWPNKFCALVVVLLSFIYLFSFMFFFLDFFERGNVVV